MNEYRGLPFWSWNGKLDKEEIIRQIHILKDMGFGGFFMHSRTGLQTEYLGKDWFDMIKIATVEAKNLGMSAWLYDEDRWPSGTAGGEVTKTKEFQMKFISMYDISENELEETLKNEEFFNIFAVKLNNDSKIDDYYKLHIGEEVKEGYIVKKFLCEYMDKQEFYNGNTYLDTLNIDATEAFLKSTHEKYKEICGDLLGESIIGIFTDEPHRGQLMNGFGIENDNKMYMVPYTYKLFEEFEKINGYKLEEKLPELFFINQKDDNTNLVMFHYIEVLEQMFLNNFAIPYQKWCKENRLIFTGHILHEDSLAIQTIFQGSVQRFYEYMDYPGIDILNENNKAYWVAKQVQSVARQLNKPFVLSELYGCTGWQMNFKNHRDVGVWQAILGVNLRCHHLSWYTMEGEAKRDYPASIFYQSGWYKDYKYIEDYFANLNEILSKGKPLCETLVINPIESVWLYPKKNWVKNTFQNTISEVIEIEKRYVELFNILTTGQVDFDYGDEDILKRHYQIISENEKAYLVIGNAKYAKVLISGMHTIRNSTLKILKEFILSGGKVVVVGYKPMYIDGICEKIERAKQYDEDINLKIQDIDDIISENKAINNKAINREIEYVNKEIDIDAENIDFTRAAILENLKPQKFININSTEIISTVRVADGGYYLGLLNTNREKKSPKLDIKFNDNFNIEEIDLITGTRVLLKNDVKNLNLIFNKGECKILYLTKNNLASKEKSKLEVEETIILKDDINYILNENNILPLDMANFRINDFKSKKPAEILRIDNSIRTKYNLHNRNGNMIQPWYKTKYNQCEEDVSVGKLYLKYSFFIDKIPKEDIKLVMEQSELYKIKINSKEILKKIEGYYIDKCFDIINIPKELLISRKNEIELIVDFKDSVNLECVYLMGNFGVKLEGINKHIIGLPKTLNTADIKEQGLPFYSGSITYLTGIKDKKVNVILKNCYGALTKVEDDNKEVIVAFDPYSSGEFNLQGELKLECVLTRRNTFGPLHYKPIYASGYGPDTFTANGDLYTDDYTLIKNGILDEIEVQILK